jgi:hypothetical protein
MRKKKNQHQKNWVLKLVGRERKKPAKEISFRDFHPALFFLN